MRIALLSGRVEMIGGTQSHLLASARALASRGHEVHILTEGISQDALSGQTLTVHLVPRLASQRPESDVIGAVRLQLTAIAPDIVHSHDLVDRDFVLGISGVAPVICSAHNLLGCPSGNWHFGDGKMCHRAAGPMCVPYMGIRGCGGKPNPLKVVGPYVDTGRRLQALRAASATIAYSEFVARHLRRNDVPRVSVVPLFAPPVPTPLRVPSHGRVMFVGRATHNKGLDVLIRAVATTDLLLDVCGDGWALERAMRLVTRLGIADRVRFRGWLSRSSLDSTYRDSTVVAVPSIWPEPFGLVGLEAMAHGRPVVASAVGGIPEWLEDGITGLLVQPGDSEALGAALRSILDDPISAERYGQNGRDRVATLFSEDCHLRALETLYSRTATAG